MDARCYRIGWVLLGGLLVAGLTLPGAVAQQAGDESSNADEGQVIQIGPDDPLAPPPRDPVPQRFGGAWILPGEPLVPRQVPPYYIGVVAGPVSDALRAHVELPAGVGLLVSDISESSPAAEAGLEPYDILVRAGDRELRKLDDLIEVVEQHAGDTPQQFTLEIIRRGRPESVWVTPATRPQPDRPVQPGFPEDRLRLDGGLEGLRLRPDLGFDFDQMPTNVSVRIDRDQDGPARITVERDGEQWVVEGDDPAALEQLPADLQPMVRRLLNAGPRLGPLPGRFSTPLPDNLRQRLDDMERQVRELQQRLLREEEQR